MQTYLDPQACPANGTMSITMDVYTQTLIHVSKATGVDKCHDVFAKPPGLDKRALSSSSVMAGFIVKANRGL